MPAPTSLSRIYFDVGGKILWTRPDTINKAKRLWNLYQDRAKHPHRDGSVDGQSASCPIRLDRDAEGFRQVLGYLRDPRYPYEPDFEYELQYYGIDYDGLFEDITDDDSSDDDSSDDSIELTETTRGRSPTRRTKTK